MSNISDNDFNFTCPITKKPILDDCHITIEFGYGSDKDCMTYKFSAVHDDVGKKVLKVIDSMIQPTYEDHPTLGVQVKTCASVEDFGRDIMDELFFGDCPEDNTDSTERTKAEWGFDI